VISGDDSDEWRRGEDRIIIVTVVACTLTNSGVFIRLIWCVCLDISTAALS